VPMQLRMLAVDSNYNTQTVLNWVRGKSSARVIAVRGQELLPIAIGSPQAVDVTTRGKKRRRGAKQWPVGTNILKTELYGWLKALAPTEEEGSDMPYGYCHFPEYSEEFFKQLTAEEVVTRIVRGYKRLQWEKIRERNEALDCRVYARAASVLCGVDRMSPEEWDALESAFGIAQAVPEPEPEAVQAPPPPREAAREETYNGVQIVRRKSSYWS